MIHVRPPFVAVYVSTAGNGTRTIDEQVRLADAYLRSEIASGRWQNVTICYYLDLLPGAIENADSGIERLLDGVDTGEIVAVVCDRFDRFDASPLRAANAISFLELSDVRLIFLDEEVDATRLTQQSLKKLANEISVAEPLRARARPSDGLRVATYVRTSSTDNNGQRDLMDQLRRTESLVALHCRSIGWQIHSHVTYQDIGKSGKFRNRPGFQQLISDVRDEKIDVVICTDLARVARTVRVLIELFELFNSTGTGFITLTDDHGFTIGPLNPTTPSAAVTVHAS